MYCNLSYILLLLQRKHPTRLKEFEKWVETKTILSQNQSKQKQLPLHFEGYNLKPKKIQTQEEMDNTVIEYLIEDTLPVYHTERTGFRNMMQRVSEFNIRSREFYTKAIKKRFAASKARLTEALAFAKFVCTTADCWSSRRRGFLGVTIHWYSGKFERKSACLAVRRIIGSVTYDVLSKHLEAINTEFKIVDRITCTVTDSGSNFIKAFRLFSKPLKKPQDTQANEDFDIPEEDETEEQLISRNEQSQTNVNDEDDRDDVTFIPITNVLSNAEDTSQSYHLPPHRRCACHTLNLIATTDISKIKNAQFKSLFKSTVKKLQAIWVVQRRSTKASDAIKSTLKTLFVIPNQTRWNSFYDAMARTKSFIIHQNDGLRKVFQHFNMEYFTLSEEQLVKEYVTILYPLTRALDILQAEKNIAIGFLLPTLVVLQKQMENLQRNSSLQQCKPIISAIIEGVKTRFGHLFDDSDLKLASILHPRFKLTWIPIEDKEAAENLLRDEYKTLKGTVSAQTDFTQRY